MDGSEYSCISFPALVWCGVEKSVKKHIPSIPSPIWLLVAYLSDYVVIYKV